MRYVGVEGIAVAAAVILLVVIVIPALYRGRAVVAAAPADERFAPDLRMIRERQYAHADTSEYRCRLYPTEHVMVKNKTPQQSGVRAERTSRVRELARERAHARAGIAARRAMRTRFGVGGLLLAAVTAILWVLKVSVSMPIAVAIGVSVVLGLYLVGFVYLARMWYSLDMEDSAIIADVEAELGEAKAKQAKTAQPRQQSKAQANRPQRASTVKSEAAPASRNVEKHSDKRSEAQPAQTAQAAKAPSAAQTRPVAKAKPAQASSKQHTQHVATAEVSQAAKIVVPSYTLKARPDARDAKKVEPYQPPAADEAPVPYRPVRVGERMGDEPLEAPNAVPEKIADKPARAGRAQVLGVGEALDTILEARRA